MAPATVAPSSSPSATTRPEPLPWITTHTAMEGNSPLRRQVSTAVAPGTAFEPHLVATCRPEAVAGVVYTESFGYTLRRRPAVKRQQPRGVVRIEVSGAAAGHVATPVAFHQARTRRLGKCVVEREDGP